MREKIEFSRLIGKKDLGSELPLLGKCIVDSLGDGSLAGIRPQKWQDPVEVQHKEEAFRDPSHNSQICVML